MMILTTSQNNDNQSVNASFSCIQYLLNESEDVQVKTQKNNSRLHLTLHESDHASIVHIGM